MGLNEPYVVDSYALIAWFREKRASYRRYFEHIQDNRGYVSPVVLMEFYFGVYHFVDKNAADQYYGFIEPYLIKINPHEEYLKEAAEYRSVMLRQKKKLSYADSLNCVMARRLNTKVLTGDLEMKDLPDVEFVQ